MSYEITLRELLVGLAANSAREGESVSIISQAFTTSDDGGEFTDKSQKTVGLILSYLHNNNIKPSMIDNLLAIIRPDNTATVYVNELARVLTARTKSPFAAGQPVTVNDILDIKRLVFENVDLPNDSGVVFYFSFDWQKALFFDLAPLGPANPSRSYDINDFLGRAFAYLAFGQIYKITDSEWDEFIEQQWFPFASLPSLIIRNMLGQIRNGWQIDEIIDEVKECILADLLHLQLLWAEHELFQNHKDILNTAIEHYRKSEYTATVAILYPRIEGLLRSHVMSATSSANFGQKNLMNSIIQNEDESSMLLPKPFERYLREVYFASFDPNNPTNISRHSVSHGVAPATLFDKKSATLSILIAAQVSYYMTT